MKQVKQRVRPTRPAGHYFYLLLLTLNVVTGLWRIQVVMDLDLSLPQADYASPLETAERSPDWDDDGESDAESQDEADYSNLDDDSLAQDSLSYSPWGIKPVRYRSAPVLSRSQDIIPEPPPPRRC
ncbi:hypothetical protein [Methylocaldum sp. 14B]|jgi:hypothetical protein|uniref:hypothetical protein n=1 Tax=unclassified Methylocaldum TaxID=2622260 RepID=UPI00098B7721|nr:hypothetical protein [Methylocaldum sp. 14B]